ncbi:MAG TPA: CBS domain-containing protein [Thermoleophilia bacterium]|nr:CBS domain-containing protein [Thermoleophilia bacterium]
MTYQRPRHEHVGTLMSRKLLCAAAGDSLTDAAHRMAERRVGAILVTEDDNLVGILTERDIMRAVGSGDITGTVDDWMTHDPLTVDPGASIGEAAMLMVHGGFRHVPIVDAGKLVGIVSIRDLLRLPTDSSPKGV